AISVADTGIGIPADKQVLVFERFQQENMTTVRRYGGSGLGLSLVKDLVAMMGGCVTLKSVPGEGAVFTVYLPVTDEGEISV
ncbi:MAG: ATP-binding protein, partial [Adlercreutzia sp.]|nr:ATP-binding protein [Adlercreutzia sp.]